MTLPLTANMTGWFWHPGVGWVYRSPKTFAA